jgi:hypothetical protein
MVLLFLLGFLISSAWEQPMTAWDSGNRQSLVNITSNISLVQGSWSNLVDGSYSSSAPSAVALTSRPLVAGVDYVQFQWSTLQQIDGFEAFGDPGNNLGTWQVQGSNDGGASFYTIAQVNIVVGSPISWTNPYGYSIYRFLAVSGSTANGYWISEFLFSRAASSNAGPPPVNMGVRPYIIFIGAGQSNEVGYAPLPANQDTAYPNRGRIHLFDLSGAWREGSDPVMSTAGSIWPAFNNTNVPQAGPQMGFADELTGSNGISLVKSGVFDIGIVPCAYAGTSITNWYRNLDPATLYGAMIARAQAALAAAPPGSFIGGFTWYQGEGDTNNAAAAFAWLPLTSQLFANVRSDLAMPNLPIVVTSIGPDPVSTAFPSWSMMQAIIEQGVMPANVARVVTRDLSNPIVGSGADFSSTASVITIGRRQAQAMKSLLPIPWI